MRAVLARYGYRVVLAADGEEALVRWAEHEDEIALLITDVVMPGRLTGRDLAAQLRAARPVLKVIYCSGYDAEILDSSALDRSGTRFLAKPFDVARLAKMVRELLDEA
jgi:CheY-like chemotaxis protein